MSSGPGEARDDLIAFRDLLSNGPMNIGERGAESDKYGLQAFSSLLLAGKRIEFDEVLKHKVIHSLEATLVEDFFDKCADGLCIRRWHGRSFRSMRRVIPSLSFVGFAQLGNYREIFKGRGVPLDLAVRGQFT